MSAPAQPMTEPMIELGPGWVVREMPPGYQNRVAEIQRLTADLQGMARFGRLLWEVGPALAEAVADMFAALKFDVQTMATDSAPVVVVPLQGTRRLLCHVSAEESPIQKKGADLARVFQVLQEVATESDRVVLVVNSDPGTPPPERDGSITPDALSFLRRMGVSHVQAPTLFALWTLALQDPDRARAQIERLHAQDGGTFDIPPSVLQ